MENNFYIKYGNNPEFSLKDITSNLTLLKLDENPSISNVYQNIGSHDYTLLECVKK